METKWFVSPVDRVETEDITVLEVAELLVVEVDQVVEDTKEIVLLVEDTKEVDQSKEVLSVHDTEVIVHQAEEKEVAEGTKEIVLKVVRLTEVIVHVLLDDTREEKDHLVVTKVVALLGDTKEENVHPVVEDTKEENVLLEVDTREVVLNLTDFEAELIHSVTSGSILVHLELLLLDTREAETNLALNVQSLEAQNARIVEVTKKKLTKLLVIETMSVEPRRLGQAVRIKMYSFKIPSALLNRGDFLFQHIGSKTPAFWQ